MERNLLARASSLARQKDEWNKEEENLLGFRMHYYSFNWHHSIVLLLAVNYEVQV